MVLYVSLGRRYDSNKEINTESKYMIKIGVTGSIGMGKTTVTKMMQEMGIAIHNADLAVARFLSAGGIAVEQVQKLFPETVLKDKNGKNFIDKQALGKIVFYNKNKKSQLEEILHPLVKVDSDKFVKDMGEQGYNIVAFEIPLLFETHRDKDMSCSICVSCSPDNQRLRMLDRPSMTPEKFDAIVAEQMLDSEKRELSDYVLLNDGSLKDTKQNLEEILKLIKERFKNQL